MLVVVSVAAAVPKAAAPAPGKQMPTASQSKNANVLSGKVMETMDAGGYTYACIERNGGKTWVAIPASPVKVGQQVTFQPGQEMRGFTSKTLNKTFDSIIFSGGLLKSASAGDGAAMQDADHGGSKAAVAQPSEKVSVAKAEGSNAYTVAEIFSQRTKLNKKTVVVKAKVVKVSAGIMDRNWIHLQDGTGDAAKGTNNLVATSKDLPQVGDVVTVKGIVYKDKDFGSGYKYNVILETATVQK